MADNNISLTHKLRSVDLAGQNLVFNGIPPAPIFSEFQQTEPAPADTQNLLSNAPVQVRGIWMYANIVNHTKHHNWKLEIANNQYQRIDFYVMSEGELIQQHRAGRLSDIQAYYRPTLALRLAPLERVEVYIYAHSLQANYSLPIRIVSDEVHQTSQFKHTLYWGAFYGAFIFLLCFALLRLGRTHRLSDGILTLQITLIVFLQLAVSNHISVFIDNASTISIYRQLDHLWLLIFICINTFTLVFLRKETNAKYTRPLLYMAYAVLLFATLLISAEWIPKVVHQRLVLVSLALCLITNIYCAFRCWRGAYQPSFVLLIGLSVALCTVLIQFFDNALIVEATNWAAQPLQIGLLVYCACALAASVMHTRHELELEVMQATADAENNYLLIEEQNVHLNIARKEALKASEVKSQFLANISHEIRTPLNAIIGFSKELLIRDNAAERDEHIRIINGSATDLLTIVNDILDFSKMEAGKLSLNEKPYSLREIFEDTATLTAKAAHLKQLEFIFDVGAMPSIVIGDAFKLKQLLNNLLSNALKFTNYGSISLAAFTRTDQYQRTNLVIEIEDTGIGISEKDKKTLFTPFHQLDDELNRSFQGTGLGLVICQELVYLMHGTIGVESVPTVGSKFTLSIPLQISNNEADPQTQPYWGAMQVGIVDSNPLNRRLSGKQLKLLGANTHSFETFDVLQTYSQEIDILFVSLPLKDMQKRTEIINKALTTEIKNIVLMHSGPPPKIYQSARIHDPPIVLRLPLTAKKLNDLFSKPLPKDTQDAQPHFANLPTARILAVDDIMINLMLLQTWFKGTPITLEIANSGAEAIEKCEHTDYDMILMDIQMPTMDGLAATRLVRQTKRNQGTPIIAITAHAFQEEKNHFLSSGMDDYLPKPIDINDLTALIQTWCQNNENPNPEELGIDWSLAVKRSNGDSQAAYEYLQGFVDELPASIQSIEYAWQKQHIGELKASVHRLHGACCYTGVSVLQQFCHDTESILKQNQLSELPKAISTMLVEAEKVMEDWQEIKQTVSL